MVFVTRDFLKNAFDLLRNATTYRKKFSRWLDSILDRLEKSFLPPPYRQYEPSEVNKQTVPSVRYS